MQKLFYWWERLKDWIFGPPGRQFHAEVFHVPSDPDTPWYWVIKIDGEIKAAGRNLVRESAEKVMADQLESIVTEKDFFEKR
jgi:alkylated DNA nucleotide flippase Atl1